MQSGNKDPQKLLYLCRVSSFYDQATYVNSDLLPMYWTVLINVYATARDELSCFLLKSNPLICNMGLKRPTSM